MEKFKLKKGDLLKKEYQIDGFHSIVIVISSGKNKFTNRMKYRAYYFDQYLDGPYVAYGPGHILEKSYEIL